VRRHLVEVPQTEPSRLSRQAPHSGHMDEEIPPLPDGWTVWNVDPGGQVILAYRPDVFEGESFPAACLPTLFVSRSSPDQRRRRPPSEAGDADWHVTFYLEPEVRIRDRETTETDRGAALEAARDVAADFAAGEIDVRAAYQVPREAYLSELERLTADEGQGA
jgi:hypothetical protein